MSAFTFKELKLWNGADNAVSNFSQFVRIYL